MFITQSLTTADCPHTLNIVFTLILIKNKDKNFYYIFYNLLNNEYHLYSERRIICWFTKI